MRNARVALVSIKQVGGKHTPAPGEPWPSAPGPDGLRGARGCSATGGGNVEGPGNRLVRPCQGLGWVKRLAKCSRLMLETTLLTGRR